MAVKTEQEGGPQAGDSSFLATGKDVVGPRDVTFFELDDLAGEIIRPDRKAFLVRIGGT